MSTLLIIILILIAFSGVGWGYTRYPDGPWLGGGVGLALLVLIILLATGRL